MNIFDTFYALAQEQLSLPINVEDDDITYKLEEYLSGYETISLQELLIILDKLDIKIVYCGTYGSNPWGFYFQYNNRKYIVELNSWPINLTEETSFPKTAHDFLEDLSSCDSLELDKYIGNKSTSFSEDFWDSAPILYHATDSANVESILENGLNPDSKTRGMSNHYVADAVFCSLNEEVIEIYGDTILVINTQEMKNDNYMPEVEQEPDIELSEKISSIASQIDENDFHYEPETGMDYDTVIVYGTIPAKYITVQ